MRAIRRIGLLVLCLLCQPVVAAGSLAFYLEEYQRLTKASDTLIERKQKFLHSQVFDYQDVLSRALFNSALMELGVTDYSLLFPITSSERSDFKETYPRVWAKFRLLEIQNLNLTQVDAMAAIDEVESWARANQARVILHDAVYVRAIEYMQEYGQPEKGIELLLGLVPSLSPFEQDGFWSDVHLERVAFELGEAYYQVADYNNALAFCRYAQDLLEQVANKDSQFFSLLYWQNMNCVAKARYRLGQYALAKHGFEKIAHQGASFNEKIFAFIGLSRIAIEHDQNVRQGLDYAIQAQLLAQQFDNPVTLFNVYFQLGRAYVALGDKARAGQIIDRYQGLLNRTEPAEQALVYLHELKASLAALDGKQRVAGENQLKAKAIKAKITHARSMNDDSAAVAKAQLFLAEKNTEQARRRAAELELDFHQKVSLILLLCTAVALILSVQLIISYRRLRVQGQELKALSQRDVSTGILNPRFGKSLIVHQFSLWERLQDFGSVVLIQLDEAPRHGNTTSAMIELCDGLKERVRRTDILVRLADDQVLMCLEHTHLSDAVVLVNELKVFLTEATEGAPILFSAGIIEAHGEQSLEEVTARCQALLVQGRRKGPGNIEFKFRLGVQQAMG